MPTQSESASRNGCAFHAHGCAARACVTVPNDAQIMSQDPERVQQESPGRKPWELTYSVESAL
jgi:hypothetical protein